MNETCRWTQWDDDSNNWSTECGGEFSINEGGPIENKMLFCCYCGKTVDERRPEPEQDEDKST